MNLSSHSNAAFFEAKYQANHDPWNFQGSEYELHRYAAVLAALEGAHFRSAVEPGCSVGVLTEALAPFCDRLLAFDVSATATRTAQARCQRFPNVRIACMALQDLSSFADFDLVVLSEVGYYFPKDQWATLSSRIVSEMSSGSILLAEHWTGHSEDHEISGDEVHQALFINPGLKLLRSERHTGFRLEKWVRA